MRQIQIVFAQIGHSHSCQEPQSQPLQLRLVIYSLSVSEPIETSRDIVTDKLLEMSLNVKPDSRLD